MSIQDVSEDEPMQLESLLPFPDPGGTVDDMGCVWQFFLAGALALRRLHLDLRFAH
jgi:hypothetical protein